MAIDIGPRIGLDGEAEFKRKLKEVDASLKALNSEMKAVTAEFQDNVGSMGALSAKMGVLNRSIQENEKRLQLSQRRYNEYARIVNELGGYLTEINLEFGENSKEAAKVQKAYNDGYKSLKYWEDQVNRTRTSLGNFRSQLEKVEEQTRLTAESFKTAAARLNSIGNTLSVGLTTPLVAAGAASFKFASDMEESLNKVDVAFKDSAGMIKAWSEDTLTSIGLARGTALDMAALYGDMATSMGYGTEQAAEMAATLVDLAADLSSFKNMDISQVNTALKSIFTGETESLKELGVVMTEVNLKQFALEEGYEKSYDAMSQLEKVQLRYEYVLAKTANAQGDFARTIDSAANQQRILKESLKEAAATLGTELLPIVTPVISKLAELAQSFNQLDEGTRKAIVQAGLFLAALGPMLKLAGGISKAIGAGVTAYNALKKALTATAAAQTAVNTAMKASPIGAIVAAVGGVVAILAALSDKAREASSANNELTNSIAESKKAWEEQQQELTDNQNGIMSTVAAVEQLAAVENKTTAQKQALLDMIDSLNEAVPNLSLAYDEQTDSLNLTTEAIRNLALAEAQRQMQEATVQRMSELYVQQAEIEKELVSAQQEYNRALEEYRAKEAEVGKMSADNVSQFNEVSKALSETKAVVDALTAAQAENNAELKSLEEEYGAYMGEAEGAAEATDGVAAAAALTSEELAELEEKAGELEKQTKTLASAGDTLSAALQEQSSEGSIALDTALDLIDAGYAAALSIDEETGAVTVNRDAYIKLAEAKIEEQIQALKTQKASVDSKISFYEEAAAANALAGSLYDAAIAAAQMAKSDDAKALKEQSTAYDVQIKALEKAKKSLKSYSGAATSAARSSASSSKKIQTQAEKDLDAFKKQKDELDHLKAMDELDEQEYYARLAEIRDRYLTDDSNISEYRKITEQIYEYDKQLAEEQEKLWQQQSEEIVSEWKSKLQKIADEYDQQLQEIQGRIEEIQAQQEAMEEKLAGYGDLFQIEDGDLSLGDLKEQLDIMDKYAETLSKLSDKGISESLMEEITALDIEDAIAYGNELLKMSESRWDEYNELWEEKQQKAKEIAEQFYKDKLDPLLLEFNNKLNENMENLKKETFDGYQEVMQSAIDGVKSKKDELLAEFRSLQKEISKETLGKYQPYTIDGSHAAGLPYVPFDGYIAELHRGEMVVPAPDAKILRTLYNNALAPQKTIESVVNTAAAGMVNGLAAINAGQAQPVTLVLQLKNGAELARWLLPDIRQAARQTPEVVSGV